MLRYTDVAWMDDRTAPSVRVRHNLEGLTEIFPPAYLLSFVIDHDAEPLHRAPDLALYFRSRMPGALGLSFRNEGFPDDELSAMQGEIALYTQMRDAQSRAAGALLTAQARANAGPGWDVLQEATDDGRQVVIWAYQSDLAVTSVIVKPKALTANATYQVRSLAADVLGAAKGSDLMTNGLEVFASSDTAAHRLILTIQP